MSWNTGTGMTVCEAPQGDWNRIWRQWNECRQ